MAAATQLMKEKATRIIQNLHDDASWEDLEYQIHFYACIERGLGRVDDRAGVFYSKFDAF
jgi:hypothetical protein